MWLKKEVRQATSFIKIGDEGRVTLINITQGIGIGSIHLL